MDDPGLGLLGHWPLDTDTDDRSEFRHRAEVRNVESGHRAPDGRRGARFDGAGSVMRVSDCAALRTGSGDFAACSWIWTEEGNSDVVGDIISRFDHASRTGFSLSVVSNAGVTSAQANYRNVHFGIDQGNQDAGWQDCGRPGRASMVSSLAVHDGELFTSTFEMGPGGLGHVWRYLGEGRWLDCGAPDGSNNVYSLAVHKERLYCGTGFYRPWDSALPPVPPPNETPGGHVYVYSEPDEWTDCGRPGDEGDGIITLVSYQDGLYPAHQKCPGIFMHEGGQDWRPVGMTQRRTISLTVYRRKLLCLANGNQVYEYEGGEAWRLMGELDRSTQNYGAAIFRGDLFVSSWPEGHVYRFSEDAGWQAACGRQGIGYQKEIMALNVYNGNLYCGTLPAGDVYRYSGEEAWARTGNLDRTPDVSLRRAWSMCVRDGRLYAGTLPSGRVYSFEAGKMASVDSPLASGWRHIAGVREKGMLTVYLDGEATARSTRFRPEDFDLDTDAPLEIGFGPHTHMDGLLADVRLYGRALAPSEVSTLAQD